MIIKVISILLFTIATYNIQMLNDQIAQVIFNNQQSYILYVCQLCDEEQLQVISQYCENKFCALVNRQVEMYERLKEFVGMKDSQYLLLLDLQKRLKYTLSANNNKLTKQDISSFQKSFSKGTLQPHYTSEDLPNQEPDKYMRKIVGLNFRQFIQGEQRIKILYLYIDNAVCDTCYDIYNKLSSIAKGLIDRIDITFGYLDLYKNQHKDLKEQSLPLILIYEKGVNQYEKFTKESLYRIQDIINSKLKIYEQQEQNQL